MLTWLAIIMFFGFIFSIAAAIKMNAPSGIEKAREALEQGRLKEAEKRFRVLARTLRYGRQHEQAYYGWAQALEQLDKISEAVDVYDKYLYNYERTGRGTRRILERIRSRRDLLLREAQNTQSRSISENVARGVLVKREPQIKIRGTSEDAPRIQVREKPTTNELQEVFGSESSITSVDEDVVPIYTEHQPENSNQLLDKYLLSDKLGEGGFGEVYQAYLPVAIKVAKNPELVENLKRLGVLQSKVKSPRIVAPIEVNLDHDPPYVVMEHIDGPNMRHLLRAHDGLPPADAVHVLKEIALGLHDAHKAGVLHLDLKPENVILSADGEIKITDFELGKDQSEAARLRMSHSLASVNDESVQGTVAYMSPEQRVGKSLDQRSDIYTAGVMLFEALTGELPQPGDKPSDFVANLPASIDRIFERCYVRYERRYQSMGELVHDLEGAQQLLSDKPNLKALVRDLRIAERAKTKTQKRPISPISMTPTPPPILEENTGPAIKASPKPQQVVPESPKISVKGEGGKEYIQPTSFQERYSVPANLAVDPKGETIEVAGEPASEAKTAPVQVKRPSLDSLIAARARDAKEREQATPVIEEPTRPSITEAMRQEAVKNQGTERPGQALERS
ncbi:MAG: protein kinase [Planctomycetota bacterium]|nr:protein kinase [Planctomycetota bacterium]